MNVITRENYYEFGDAENVVVSNSLLNYINPWQGGSVEKMRMYLTEADERKESMHLEKGRLFHKYIEDKSAFIVAPEDRPSDTIVDIVKDVFDHAVIVSAGNPGEIDSWEDAIKDSVEDISWNPKWKMETRINKVIELGKSYWEFLKTAEGKVMLKAETKECLSGMINALNASQYAEEILHADIHREVPFTGKYNGIPVKCLVDMLHVDSDAGVFYLDDIKTTSESAQAFLYKVGPEFVGEEGIIRMVKKPGSFFRYRYYRQLAFYNMIVKQSFPGFEPVNHIYVHETKPPYEICKYHINPAYVAMAEEEIAIAMNRVKDYIAKYSIEEAF